MLFNVLPNLRLRKHQVKHVLKAHSGIQPLHFLPINPKTQSHLALQIQTTTHATSPQVGFSTSCSMKASTHIKNHQLPMR